MKFEHSASLFRAYGLVTVGGCIKEGPNVNGQRDGNCGTLLDFKEIAGITYRAGARRLRLPEGEKIDEDEQNKTHTQVTTISHCCHQFTLLLLLRCRQLGQHARVWRIVVSVFHHNEPPTLCQGLTHHHRRRAES